MGWSEFVATFGLLMVIWGCVRQQLTAVPYAVAAYITSAYWFTASTSFANPAVTLARAASNTFAGIRPADVAGVCRSTTARGRGSDAALALAACPHRALQTNVDIPHGAGVIYQPSPYVVVTSF